jgi:hypothetical protein
MVGDGKLLEWLRPGRVRSGPPQATPGQAADTVFDFVADGLDGFDALAGGVG